MPQGRGCKARRLRCAHGPSRWGLGAPSPAACLEPCGGRSGGGSGRPGGACSVLQAEALALLQGTGGWARGHRREQGTDPREFTAMAKV